MIHLISHVLLFLLISLSAVSVAEQTAQIHSCGLNTQATELAQLIQEHPAQQRQLLQCNDDLTKIAQQRAEHMAKNNHDPNISPNQVVMKGGFRFPSYYPTSGNQVEAVARDTALAAEALSYLITSNKHHDHIMGVGEFFGLQSQLGIGYYHDAAPTTHQQWVILIAEPWQTPKIVYKQDFNMPFKIAKGCEKDWQNSNDEFLKRKCRSMSGKARNNKKDVKLMCDEKSCTKE